MGFYAYIYLTTLKLIRFIFGLSETETIELIGTRLASYDPKASQNLKEMRLQIVGILGSWKSTNIIRKIS